LRIAHRSPVAEIRVAQAEALESAKMPSCLLRTFNMARCRMAKKRKPTQRVSSSKKKSINTAPPKKESKKKFAPGDSSDQDIKRRLGNFASAGEAHFSLKGTRGKNRKPKKG
jgi:hypothetical protein